ncbi:MAG: serine/threonine-protein kinase [Thermoanaerobaculia bacterium]
MSGETDATEPWERVEALFHAALERPADERHAFLDRKCGGDGALAARVRALLAADDGAEALVDEHMAQALGRELSPDGDDEDALPFERIGPYRLLHEIGRGGLNTVYLAQRDDEHFEKQVALKLVRRGLDTDDVLLRFRYERQILARLEHPNIARLLDGGSTEDGRPFFVMEQVVGLPIDSYCARRGLDLRRRIELFRAVCGAVSYAHQNLVVHRDLKPSNILVDGDGRPKLLDFGIAKLLDTEEFPATRPYTEKGLVLLTPEYASPEQVLGHSPTTQTDVYSLAVVLYRLLSGVAPYAVRSRLADLVHTICEVEPTKPSAATISAEDLRVAGLPYEPRRLRRRLTGDLDTILGKALRKEPRRRYASVEQFSEDLRRFLGGEHVLARPESFGYRAFKFVGRHRGIVSALAAAVLVLVLVVGYYTLRLRQERDTAQWQADKAERVSSLLVGMLEISDPGRTRGETVTALELLERAAGRLDSELAEQPEMRASLMELIGSIYSNLGLHDEAEPLLQEALAIHRGGASEDAEIAAVLSRLAELRYRTGAYDEAEEMLRDALSRRLGALGADHPLVGTSLGDLAAVLHSRGQYEDAESLYRRALANLAEAAGEGARERLMNQNNLALLLLATRRLDEAETLARETLDRQREVLGDRHPDVAVTENTLATILIGSRQYQAAEPFVRAALQRKREHYGPEHPKVAVSLVNLGLVHYHQLRFDEAEALYLEALAIQQASGEDSAYTVTTLKNLADVAAFGRKDLPAAIEWLRRALELQRRIHRSAHFRVSMTLLRLGRFELRNDQMDEARQRLEEATRIHRELEAQGIPSRQLEIAAELRSALAVSNAPP